MIMRTRSVRASRAASKPATSNQPPAPSTSITKAFLPPLREKSLLRSNQLEHRITHRQQHERIHTVFRVRTDRARKKQHGANQRERRRHRISPHAIRSRLLRLAPAQHKQRHKREYVINHEEEREHRNDRLKLLAKNDEHQRH